jgi:hypothetical protein
MKTAYVVAIIHKHHVQYLTAAGRLSIDRLRAKPFKTRAEALKVARRVHQGQVVIRYSPS